MRKIHILKAIVDFIWIVSIPIIPFAMVAIPLIFFMDDLGDFDIKINGVLLTSSSILSKLLIAVSIIAFLLTFYSLYLFRKVLAYFLRLKIFDDTVISSFNKIGNLLVVSGILSLAVSFIFTLYFKHKITFEVGYDSKIIIICFGLFFMVLSEVFKISKGMKEENDLTI
ncbi:DUF2975 domain-containing protein [Lutibacter sp.]|uniref:DUF2975 domain-containing protein n=1 Tax=Lutibacter sp. TaxID=1925666 RepID=UPI0025C51E63|nr:DUF2975 domain-containing protein [Lutibacter sp.]MCF6168997.1 DUF2975 domain-containing protein [Lutibacter sp.]